MKTKEELLQGLSDNAKWLQKLQASENNDAFNEMLGNVYSYIDEDKNDYAGGWSHYTTQYRDSSATATANKAANDLWGFVQTHGDAGFKTAMNELSKYNEAAKKSDWWYKNVDNEGTVNGDLTSNALDFITGKGRQQEYEKRISEINQIKSSYLSGQYSAIATEFERQKQNMMETNRRYGITGAQAQANLQNLMLKRANAISEAQSKAALDIDKQYNASMLQLNRMKDINKQNATTDIIKLVNSGAITTKEGIKERLKSSGVTHSLDDSDIQSILDNKGKLADILKTL